MAFNFNWLPLDTSSTTSSAFYEQAKSLLTAALNKSAKPPIIVDDILVDDLNLGASAPDLEILEIGDIAEDRFRGIFRMNYAGDAFLTLRTKVQANPLNTYLSTTPAFTSPGPLVASTPLTIPVQITLSQFKLSGFVILVFSKAKGITLVFRNDPLESLKVSSTFDSIPFIANYLQKEIERQVRRIFQEDLPVAVHRLSLRLWNPEYAASLDNEATLPSRPASPRNAESLDTPDADNDYEPFASPSLLDGREDVFSSKNVAHMTALGEAQKTLSLVTPKLRDVVFRAWACGPGSSMHTIWDKPALDFLIPNGELPADLAETRSIASTTPGHSPGHSPGHTPGHTRRPSLSTSVSSMSVATGTTTPSRPPLRRKKKHRVVNLRKTQSATSTPGVSTPASEDGGSTTPQSEPSETIKAPPPPPPPLPAFPSAVQSPIVEEEAPSWEPDAKQPAQPQRFRHDSIDYESRPPIELSDKERQRMLSELGPQVLQQAFIAKLVHEMRMRLKEEHEARAPGEKIPWGVERELEQLEGEGLPAYGA